MEITVQTRHLDIPDQLRSAATEKAQHLERFLEVHNWRRSSSSRTTLHATTGMSPAKCGL